MLLCAALMLTLRIRLGSDGGILGEFTSHPQYPHTSSDALYLTECWYKAVSQEDQNFEYKPLIASFLFNFFFLLSFKFETLGAVEQHKRFGVNPF